MQNPKLNCFIFLRLKTIKDIYIMNEAAVWIICVVTL